VRFAARAASGFLAAFENDDGDADHDGEVALLHRVGPDAMTMVFDVGANVGRWAAAALQAFPGASVHAFEPAPPTFELLTNHIGHHTRVQAHRLSLGARTGVARLFYDPLHPEMASLAAGANAAETYDVEVVTGDDFLAGAGIERVDLLKIDAEGHDLAVLHGFRHTLQRDAITMVQFEVSMWNAIVGVWVRELFEALGDGWTVGRVYPSWVEFAPYSPALERFHHRGNFVAVRADRSDLVAAVGGR
jgi:FkbM family methyltransferase